MTPTATTPAGRAKKPRARSASAARSASLTRSATPATRVASSGTARANGHKRTAQPASPARRVSGPKGGVGTTRRAPAPSPRPRRVSGPARTRPQHSRTRATLPVRLSRFVRTLPDHLLLDRVVRGRAWIPLLGVLLAGIVAMQVEVLKLSASMGRSLEQGTALQSRNEQLRASVAQLCDDQRIERIAATMGMVMPSPSAVKFLARSPGGQMGRALAGIQTPNPTAFASALAADQAALSVGTTAMTTSSTPSTATATTPALAQAAPAPVTTATTSPGVPSSTPSATTTPTATTPAAAGTAAPASAPTTYAPTTYAPTTSAGGAAAAGALAPGAGG
jgi:hypothetical protein